MCLNVIIKAKRLLIDLSGVCSIKKYREEGVNMKKLILLAAGLLVFNSAEAYDYIPQMLNDTIKENQTVEYCPEQSVWTHNSDNNCITFTKHITHGTGGFSEYEFQNKLYGTGTTYEFLYNNQLIGYNAHSLKFYKIDFNEGRFVHTVLDDEQLKELFPNLEIIKVSQFQDNEITVKKPWFKDKTFLLVNDTTMDFYKYQFENYSKQNELIRGLFEANKPRTFIFSHFGSRDKLFPILTIHVKNSFKKD